MPAGKCVDATIERDLWFVHGHRHGYRIRHFPTNWISTSRRARCHPFNATRLHSNRTAARCNSYQSKDDSYLFVFCLVATRRGLGEDAVLVAGAAGNGRPASCAVLVEQGHRAEFRYRIIVRCVNCTIRVHRCGWYSKGGTGAEQGEGREKRVQGDSVLIAVRRMLCCLVHTYA